MNLGNVTRLYLTKPKEGEEEEEWGDAEATVAVGKMDELV